MEMRISEPEDFARELTKQFLLSPPVDLYALAAKFDLKIKEVDARGFEGALVRRLKRHGGGIAVRKDIRELGRKRFTIAHEIGHYVMPGHGECHCKSEDIESWRVGIPAQEIAANRFAAELLLPAKEVYRVVRKDTATIAVAQTLSEQFQTSLTATALRCVEVTDEQCAVVMSKNGQIEWVKPNDSFRLYLRKGTRLDDTTHAMRLTKNPGERCQEGFVSAGIWADANHPTAIMKIWEDSIALPHYNSVLTILTVTG